MANLVDRCEFAPKRFWAGEFPVVTDTGTAGEAISQYDMIMTATDGGVTTIKKATTEGIANVAGIALTAADVDEPVVYALTGEVFADAVGLNGIDAAAAKAALRKLSIFMK